MSSEETVRSVLSSKEEEKSIDRISAFSDAVFISYRLQVGFIPN